MPGPFDGPVTGTPPYPVIDTDPHAFRVVRYFRTRDYATWGTTAVGIPAAFYVWGRFDPMPSMSRPQTRALYMIATSLGVMGGFLMAYQNSSKRFWGWTENNREQKLDRVEMTKKIASGEALYGESPQPEHMQKVAVSNSRHSQLFFSVMPWFNFVNHPYHGDHAERYQTKESETSSTSQPS
ncbi:hypothetical protein FRC14_002340 [Serendipita sp. 396]|nr:hypothetical protein FRC14_002340 [Serendipita sp. 396]KAG8788627.1 hypothetical protein FRC15_003151 [Serendipita sp. 397]KAG8803925.1 hypothetical protein FRC16_002039 [Serendipita sp. 398]KAG8828085.1 hypothetical protein FRC19_009941 [Serendipita sp. 401]KAG8838908.1 hypothetical protein FRC18_002136 [Serendipita sp. 400]KAG8840800.1 hypothetical protein FRB91_005663 [Serendipita sp. 411]KAG8875247.1 hypothetical protein FRC20_004172 [Serendipita sp. 405]KAG9058396.1 hypothetical prot